MNEWVLVTTLTELPTGNSLEVVVADQIVALFNVAGTIFAMDGVCPHQGGPLGKGSVDDNGCVTCPWHGWQFDIRTGKNMINSSIEQPLLEVKVTGQQVFVSVSNRS